MAIFFIIIIIIHKVMVNVIGYINSINQSITLLRINDIHKNYYKKVIQYKYTTMWRLNVVSY